MTQDITTPLAHVGMFSLEQAKRLIANGYAKGWLTKRNVPAIAPRESAHEFLQRAKREADKPFDSRPSGM